MKRIALTLLVGVFITAGGSLFAQKLKSGSFSALKGQTSVNLQYDYSNMKVGKYKNADEYVAKRVKDMNKKKAGTGDTWAVAWENDRSARFQPMFEKNFNGNADKCGLAGKEGADATYTLIIKTVFTEPGYNIGVSRKNAYINMVVDLVETANPGTVLGSCEYKNIQSVNMGGYDYDTGTRIQSCYDRAGDKIGNFVCKYMDK
ncbi:hypothetical protein ACFLS7_04820 [Bacteroidota bacterium]